LFLGKEAVELESHRGEKQLNCRAV